MIWLGNFLRKCEPDIEVILHLDGEEIACTAGGATKFIKTDALKNTLVGSIDVNTDYGALEIWPEDEHEVG